ncbi:MAG: SLC45 family MFS transporter [bacterium]|nr:SLC45 family MFS transporter [bacterium]
MGKKRLSMTRMCFLNIGNLGQNYGWGLFFAFMSPIFEYLGAKPDQISGLWLAGPVMGIVTQVIAGKWSDWCWTRFGRRKPFMFIGTLIVAVCFFGMVSSTSLTFVLILFWIMMTAANLVQGPYRALLADVLPKEQVATGFIIQFIFGGIGTTIAYFSPWILTHLGVSTVSHAHTIPFITKLSFVIGGFILLVTIIISCLSIRETPPENMEEFKKNKKGQLSILRATGEIFNGIFRMPKIMRQVCLAVFFSCLGAFLQNVYFTTAIAENIYGGKVGSSVYAEGIVWAGVLLAINSMFSVVFSLFMPLMVKYISLKGLYAVSQAIGGIAFICLLFISNPTYLIIPMLGVGIMQAGSGTIPFAIIGFSTKQKDLGTNMGVVNIFTTLPQLLVSLGFGYVMANFLSGNSLYALIVAGVCLIISGIFAMLIQYKDPKGSLKLADL